MRIFSLRSENSKTPPPRIIKGGILDTVFYIPPDNPKSIYETAGASFVTDLTGTIYNNSIVYVDCGRWSGKIPDNPLDLQGRLVAEYNTLVGQYRGDDLQGYLEKNRKIPLSPESRRTLFIATEFMMGELAAAIQKTLRENNCKSSPSLEFHRKFPFIPCIAPRHLYVRFDNSNYVDPEYCRPSVAGELDQGLDLGGPTQHLPPQRTCQDCFIQDLTSGDMDDIISHLEETDVRVFTGDTESFGKTGIRIQKKSYETNDININLSGQEKDYEICGELISHLLLKGFTVTVYSEENDKLQRPILSAVLDKKRNEVNLNLLFTGGVLNTEAEELMYILNDSTLLRDYRKKLDN